MMKNNPQKITIATRDSLLALAQTITVALRLEKAGTTVKLLAMKTAGDLKLNSPLYSQSNQSTKEGRAFFTKELENALLDHRADIAVHSLKDLPVELPSGLSMAAVCEPTSGRDILISRHSLQKEIHWIDFLETAPTIGTSSLRRIHQLQLISNRPKLKLLRGNLITRFEKLENAWEEIDAILIAEAGLMRLKTFSYLPAKDYAHLLDSALADAIERNIERFKRFMEFSWTYLSIPERTFPTACGQGVLAIESRTDELNLTPIFSEHNEVLDRVEVERSFLTALNAGCHAPLGVNLTPQNSEKMRWHEATISYSAENDPEKLTFAKSVMIHRNITQSIDDCIADMENPIADFFWWGKKNPRLHEIPTSRFIQCLHSKLLNPKIANPSPDIIFAASPEVIDLIKARSLRPRVFFIAAGKQTAEIFRHHFPDIEVRYLSESGIRSAIHFWQSEQPEKSFLWLGSVQGLSLAQNLFQNYRNFELIAVYENLLLPLTAKMQEELEQHGNPSVHIVASRAAAMALESYYGTKTRDLKISCFGESAEIFFLERNILPYHTSRAESFQIHIEELTGTTHHLRRSHENN